MRRLLKPREVALKLGRSHDWFLRNREMLYKAGFPLPVIGAERHGRARYDDGAIDAWLDSKMDPKLRAHRPAVGDMTAQAAKNWDNILEQRLAQQAAA